MSQRGAGLDRREFLATAGAAACLGAAPAFASQPSPEPLTFLALGDWGVKGGRAQGPVAQAMGRAADETAASFVISAGDNFYPGGVRSIDDPQWKTSFEDVYTAPALQVPWYAALGNHDYRGHPDVQQAYARTSARWRMPGSYYVVRDPELASADLEIFVLDTTPMAPEPGEALARFAFGRLSLPDPAPQLAWLETELAQSTAAWKIVVGHHPIRSGGKHGGSSELAAQLEPLLDRHGVQAYVCGHDHVLQHIQAGATHHVCTGAGASAGPVKHVAGSRFAAGTPGFAQFTLDPAAATLQLAFRGADGAVLHRAEIARSI
jgi:acid phosphatase